MPHKRILVVNGSPSLRSALRTVLETAGYAVVEAATGRAALEAARFRLPHLVLLDLMTPELDGWKIARVLRCDSRTAEIPILAISAWDVSGVAEVGDAELCAVLRIPFTVTDLMNTVGALLEDGQQTGSVLLRDVG